MMTQQPSASLPSSTPATPQPQTTTPMTPKSSNPVVNSILTEHNYSKPWKWKQDATYAKPVRSLFTLTKAAQNKLMVADITVDVETVDSPHQFQPMALTSHPSEWVAAAEDVQGVKWGEKDESDDGDWESKVPKIGWTVEHYRLFNNVVKALHEAHLAQLALTGRSNEAIQKKLAVDTAARRVRRAMASATWDIRLTHWLHNLLQEHMPPTIFAVYLEVLRVLRIKAPSLVEHMVTFTPDVKLPPSLASEKVVRLLRKECVEPGVNQLKPRRLPLDPILITVPSGIGRHVGHASRRNNNWVKQLSHLGQVACVDALPSSLPGHYSIENMLDQLLSSTRAKIDEVKVKYPGRPIILIGWNVGAGIAVQAALMESVHSVICLGFPISTLAGRRGQADDCLLDLACPILFVIGQNAPSARQADIEELRERLKVQSGLIVIGSADEHLRVTSVKKRSEGLTQSMIDRCILDEVGDFLASVLTQPIVRPVSPRPLKQALTNSSPSVGEPEIKKPRLNSKSTFEQTPKTPKEKPQVESAPKPLHRPMPSPQLQPSNPNPLKLPVKPGITVNIGSLASLGPIGPIRLGNSKTSPSVNRVHPTMKGAPSPTVISSLTSFSSLMTASSSKVEGASRPMQMMQSSNMSNLNTAANLASTSKVKYVNKVASPVAKVLTSMPIPAPNTPR